MAQSSVIIGKVVAIQGNVSIRLADKTVHPLKLGDAVHEGDVILTGPGGFVELGSDNGGTLLVRENETVMLDATVFGAAPATADAALLPGDATLDDVAKAIADGGSLDSLLDETAAGFSGGGGDDGSHSFVRLLRIAEALDPVGSPYGDQEGLVQQHPIGAAENVQQGLPTLEVSSPDVFETGGFAIFNVSLSSASTTAITVNLGITDGTATSADHGDTIDVSTDGGKTWIPSTSVVINPGTISVLVRVAVIDDSINETPESFTLTATSGGGTANDSAAGTATIIDNESTPSLFVNDVTVNEAAGTVTFTVSLSNSSTSTVTVNYATGDGSATAGSDYTAGAGTLSFAPGQTSRTVTVAITDDLQSEGNETFNLRLSSPVNATIADGTGTATIVDNDSSTLSVSNVTVGEGDGFAVFTVSLSTPSSLATMVSLSLNDGSAGTGDFDSELEVSVDGGVSWQAGSEATFAPGTTSLLVRTPVINDDVSESSESFTLTATVTGGRTIGAGATGTATIIDNDTAPALSVNDVTVNEAAGTMTFTVSLSRASSAPVTVDYATGDGSATAGSDYTAAAGTLRFAAGETSKTITIAIANDALLEGDENFKIMLSGPTNAVIADGAGIGTIVDNDTPSLSVSNVTVSESAGHAVFTVSLSNPSTQATSLSLALHNGSANAADYGPGLEVSSDGGATWVAGATATIAAGTTSVLVRTPVINDGVVEGTENFTLTATAASGTANGSATGTATVVDASGPPSLFINDVTVNEAAGTATFTVSLGTAASSAVTVDYATSNGTATAGSDYTAANGTLTFAAGETTKTITVAIGNDNVFELAETFNVTLSNAANAVIGDGTGVATIIDNDTPTLAVSDVAVNEAAGFAVFTVSLSNPSSVATTVSLALANGSAGAPDYGPGLQVSTDGGTTWGAATSATIAAGQTSVLVRTAITNDNISELAEDFTLTATVTAGTTVNSSAIGTATITDNDGTPTLSINDVTVNEAAGTVTFTVTLSNPSSSAVTVDYATADGSALAGTDYTAAAGTVTFAAGETTKTVTVAINNDNLFETSENFSITLSNAANATIADGTGIATITDNDLPTLAVSDVTVSEGGGFAVFTVSLSNPSAAATSVSLALNSGTAGATDFGAGLEVSTDGGVTWTAATAVTMAAGTTDVLARVAVTDDALAESSEDFTLTATAAPGTTVNNTATGTATIIDNDGAPLLSINDVTVNEAAGTVTFTVLMSHASSSAVSVNYATSNGTATAGADYSATNGTLNFASGETSKTITVSIADDNVFEVAETFNVTLSSPVNATIADGTGVATITDNDTPTLAVSDIAVNEAAGFAVFTVSLSNPSSVATTVSLALANGSAGAPDYGPGLQVSTDGGTTWGSATTATIAAGQTSVLVRTAITDDNISELAEDFTLTATVTAGTTVNANATGTATITDNDGTPTLSVNDVTVSEAAGTVTFTVTLSHPSSSAVTVDYATADGTATAGSDYTAGTGTLTFAAGETTKTITVAINNDNLYETAETFSITLSNPANAAIADATGIATITDNDIPALSVSDVSVNEGAGFAVFTVALSNPSVQATSFSLALANGTAGAADFGPGLEVSTDGGTTWTAATAATIAAGNTSVLVRTPITNDTLSEGLENFTLTASVTAGTTSNASAAGTATIVDNDGTPALTIDDVTVNESAGTVTFTVTMSNASSNPVTVDYATADGTATAGSDYTAANGTLTFAAGETSKTITVAIANDTLFESPETFNVALTNAVNATIADGTGVATVTDDDTPTIAVSSPSVNEGDGFAVFTVSLSNASAQPTGVSFALGNGTAGGADFGPGLEVSTDGGATWTTAAGATIAAGATSVLVRTPVINDTVSEGTENFTLTATAAAGTTSNGSATGTATIIDNDGAPTLSVNDITVNEAAGTATFTVSLSNASSSAVTVDYATSNGTAVAGSDYTATTGTLTFAAGETTKTIVVAIGNDTVYEGNETFNVTLSNPANATLTDATGVATIIDNDTPTLSVSNVVVAESAGHAVFSVSLSNASVQATTVALVLNNGTAGAADFGPALEISTDGGTTWTAGTSATIAAGDTSVLVRTTVADDNISELSENFTLTATVTAGTTSNSSASGTATITDNDGTPQLSINDLTVNEAAGTATFTVTMSNPSSRAVTVDYATSNGSATAGSDYTAINGTLSFAAGETSKTITVNIADDNVFENGESFNVVLANAVNAAIADGTGVATILDNDTPALSVSSTSVNEGDGFAVFTISLSNPSSVATTVALALGNGTATAPDYGPALQVSTDGGTTWVTGTSATIAAGQTSVLVRTAIVNDNISEGSESFTLTGTVIAGTTSNASATGTATIADNDGTPSLTISDVTVDEAAGTAVFTVTLSNPSSSTVSVDYATGGGTATAGADYTACTGTVSFAAGETSKTITVPITDDALFESSETFNVTLSNPSNATIADGTGVATITDNDTPSLSVSDISVAESAGFAVFTVSLSNPGTAATTVALALNNGSAGAADFGPALEVSADGGTTWASASSATIAAGATSVLVRTPIVDDALNESSENFTLTATVTAGTTSNNSATGTAVITDNDALPTLSIDDVSVNETAGTVTFTVSLSAASGGAVSVNYATGNGTAVAGSDYTAGSGTLHFASGETTKTITVGITDDNVFENSETFTVNLSGAVNAAIAGGTGVATITDNDTPALAVNNIAVNEGDGFAVFTVSLSNPSSVATTVALALVNGTAGAGDFGPGLQVSNDGGATWGTATSATISAGATSVLVRTALVNDNISESLENFSLTATVTGGTTSNAVATGTATIADNDGIPALSVDDVTVNEAAGTVVFTVTLSNPSSSTVTVDYATSNGTATAGSDYTTGNGTLTFAAGETTKTITVAVNNDNLYELTETFNVTLSNPANATIADGDGVATLTDNDMPSLAVSNIGVSEGDGYAVFTVSLSNPSSQATSFSLALNNGSAGAADFGPALEVSTDGGTTWTSASSATIAAGATSVLARTPLADDAISENTENFSLSATVTAGTTSNASATGTATITDNDGVPQLTIDDVTVNETAGTVTFTVTMSNASSNTVTVDYATSNGSATAGSDYTAINGTLSFAPGETSKTLTVSIVNDIVYEGSETFNVTLSNAAGAAILDGSGLGTIVDTTPPTLSVSNTTVNEGDGFAVFTLSLSSPSSQATTMSLALANLTASAGDFGPGLQVSADGGATWTSSATATIAAGATSVLVRTPIIDDNISESSENFMLTATVTGGVTSNASAAGTGTIIDNETTPQLSINDITVNEGAGTATFTVTLSHPSASAVSVNYATQDGTALAGADYSAATGTVNFAAGETSKTITIAITNDTLGEDAESFKVALSNAVNADLAGSVGIATIIDNDLPTLSVSNQNVSEGDGFVVFTVSLSNPSVHAIPVSLALSAGSAGAGDFGPGIEVSADGGVTWTAASGAIIAAGATSVLVRTPLIDDAISEALEDFRLTATAAASLTTNNTAFGTATIVDNDGTPQLSINDVTVDEAAGTMTFTVSMSNPSAGTVTVDYTTSNGTATAGSDYTAVNGTLSFAAGETSKTITVSITDDNLFELAETFNVTLSNPANATIADGLAVGTITDNDTPALSISSPNVNEGDGFAVFTVSLSNPSSQITTVSLALGNGTATAPDYGPALQVSTDGGTTWVTGTSATIAAGQTSVLVRTAIVNDNISEGSETFTLTGTVIAGTTSNASAVGTATIADNDGIPSLTINDVTVNEAAGTAVFTVTLSNPSSSTVSVDYATGGGTATAGSDYTGIAGTISFAAGETSKTITVSIVNDTLYEASETFNVTLSNPSNATIADNTGVGTIIDNDTPTLTVSSPTVTESAGFAVFTVSLSNPSSVATSMSLALANGTAGAADFGPGLQMSTDGGTTWGAAASATIAAGQTSVLVRTPIVDDALNENSENFTLTATVTAGTTSNASATGTAVITDNDPQPSLAINDVTVGEAAGTATFTVTLSAASGNTVTVNYATGNGTATAGSDYTATSGTLTFAPGETSKTIVVNITNDLVAESTETFNVTLSGATNATIADNLGVGTITDNDFAPVLDLDASAAGSGYTTTYTENGAGIQIANTNITITDADSTTLTGATITLTNAQTGDVLAAGAMPAGITSLVAGNTITLSGSASLASYQTAIRAITFSNTTENPDTTARSITVVVNDGANNSNIATATINVISVNDAPTASNATLAGTEDTALVFTWANFGIADVDNVASSLSLRVKTLPLDGTLQVWNGAAWAAVAVDQLITKATIDSGGFRFMPDANESGADGFPTAGTGNLKTDYASFTYQAWDGALNSTTATARIDIAPVADTPSLTVTNNAATLFTTGWETPASTVDSNPTITSAATLEGWTLVTSPDNFNAGTNVFKTWTTGDTLTNQAGSSTTVSAATGNGIDWLDLSNATTGQNQTLGVSRSVATVNGRVYELSLDAAGWPGFTSAYTKINVLVDGVSIGTYAGVSPQNALDWSNLHFSFTGNGASRTITILTDATSFNNAGRGMMIDDIQLRGTQGAIQGNTNSGTQTSLGLSQYISTALADTDGSETLTLTIGNIPAGGIITTAAQPFGISPLGGSVTLAASDISSAALLLPSSYLGAFSLSITATATEPDGGFASNAATLQLEVLRNGVDVITIDDPGVNDAPIARADAPTTALVEDGAVTTLSGNAVTGSGAGNVADSDNEGDTIRVTGAVAGASTTPASNTALASPVTVAGTYGSLQIAANGSYTYTLNNSLQATQNLMNGETAIDVFTYKITDGNSTATATITIQIQGAADINASTPTLITITTTGGLNGEYYGYNDSASPGAGFRLHTDDGSVGNLDRVSDLETLINARNVTRGGVSNVVGTEISAVTNAPDVRFSAKTLDYGFNPVVGSSLGTNPNVAAGTSLSTTNNASTNAFSTFLDTDDVSAVAEQGTGSGSGLGKTSDAMVRLTGAIFFERGNYDFRVIADDGFRLKVAGETLIEFDGNQAPTSRVFKNVQIDDRIEGLQPFELLYWEQGGNARLRVEYKLTSDTTFKLLSLDNLALFTNENAPVISDRRTQDIVETATNGVYAVRTGSVIDGGNGNDSLTGNAGRDFIHAGAGDDILSGGGGADYLDGGAGNDILDGGDGPDILDGGTGNDTMQGGLGDDLFLVDSTGDVVSDTGGTDTIELQAGYSSSYTLGAGFENLTIKSTADINGTGNALSNRIVGGDGSNVISGLDGDDYLVGGRGNDTLTGGNGSDVFAWNLADRGTPGSPALDVVTDFTYGTGYSTIESGTSYGNPTGGTGAPIGGGDRLDLRDLLSGESSTLVDQSQTPDIGNLLNYLDIVKVGADTVIRVSTTGGFAGGTYSAAAEDQRITLQGVDLFTATGMSTETTLLQELLKKGTLLVD